MCGVEVGILKKNLRGWVSTSDQIKAMDSKVQKAISEVTKSLYKTTDIKKCINVANTFGLMETKEKIKRTSLRSTWENNEEPILIQNVQGDSLHIYVNDNAKQDVIVVINNSTIQRFFVVGLPRTLKILTINSNVSRKELLGICYIKKSRMEVYDGKCIIECFEC